MVKRQKEKQYQSTREQRDYGKSRAGTEIQTNLGTVQKILPFACCALTLTPFETPVCTMVDDDDDDDTASLRYAVLFDNASLMEYVLKHQKDPVTGKSLKSYQIIRLHMDQDSEGRWQCPILTKPFADHTKIVAVLDKNSSSTKSSKVPTKAYVYSYDAYYELNVKPKNWVNLTTGNKFHPKKDVLLLNDPNDPLFQSKRDISKFWHVQHNRGKAAASTASSSSVRSNHNIQKSVTATRIMEQIEKEKQKVEKSIAKKMKTRNDSDDLSLYEKAKQRNYRVLSRDVTGVNYSSGNAAGSLTSTSIVVDNQNKEREATEEEILQSYFRILKSKRKGEKGYVKLVLELLDQDNDPETDFVEVLLELHCDIVPRTCMNFMGLCRENHYIGTEFHRVIPFFMMQGGKARQDEKDISYWGSTFKDEFDDRLKHTEAGVLSMANAGPNTNLQQFFITFKDCPHLDRKHSVFGLVVDGMERLSARMRSIKTDKRDRPVGTSIKIAKTQIITDPIQEVQDMEDSRLQKLAEEREGSVDVPKSSTGNSKKRNNSSSTGIREGFAGGSHKIGKYLSRDAMADLVPSNDTNDEPGLKTTIGGDSGSILLDSVPAIATRKRMQGSFSNPSKSQFGNFGSW